MKTLRLFAFAPLLLASVAHADWTQGSQEVSLLAGVALPMNKQTADPGSEKVKLGGPGLSIGGEYFFHVLPQVALGLDISYFKLGRKTSGAFLSTSDAESSSKSTLLMGMAKYSFGSDSGRAFLPYVVGGIGLHVSTLKLDAKPAGGSLVNDTQSNVALTLGAGTDISMTPRLNWGLEARYTYLGSVDYSPTALGRSAGLSSVSGSEHLIQLLAKAGIQF